MSRLYCGGGVRQEADECGLAGAVWLSPLAIAELKRIVSSSEIVKFVLYTWVYSLPQSSTDEIRLCTS